MIKDDEYLERIVAGIQAATSDGADVTWNETINGRQFDVVVRFKLGTLRYLVLIEVKNRKRRAEASDIEAFVTKARDQNANKAVFVTAAGFQDGAIEVARRHGVDAFVVYFSQDKVNLPHNATYITIKKEGTPNIPPTLEIGDLELMLAIERVRVTYDDGLQVELPTEPSQMTYYVSRSRLSRSETLDKMLTSEKWPNVALDEKKNIEIEINPPEQIDPPDDYFLKRGNIKSLQCTLVGVMGRGISGNIQIDPGLFTSPVIYRNAATNEELEFSLHQLPIGVRRVAPGKFYFQMHPIRYYYCDSISESSVKWYMVESFQNAELIQTITTQDIKYSYSYIELSDKKIIKRLQTRLERMKSK